jgi:hypothetical protein
MSRFLKSGSGWRIGYDPEAVEFKGLVGTDDWALELTEAELDDFCRLLGQLVDTMKHMATELMDEEAIACEVESDRLRLEAEGYPQAYTLHLIVLNGRRAEGRWFAQVVNDLFQATCSLKVF